MLIFHDAVNSSEQKTDGLPVIFTRAGMWRKNHDDYHSDVDSVDTRWRWCGVDSMSRGARNRFHSYIPKGFENKLVGHNA